MLEMSEPISVLKKQRGKGVDRVEPNEEKFQMTHSINLEAPIQLRIGVENARRLLLPAENWNIT